MSTSYDAWTKEQLIARIRELEPSKPEKPAPQKEKDPKSDPKPKKVKSFDLDKHPARFIALRFSYLGWNYNGLSFQFEPTPLPTVEEELLQALYKSKLISSPDPGSCNFSRCGRTDKGVSAMNQVVALTVRSSLSEQDQQARENDEKEVPYMTILNSLLPMDIRITSICLRPPADFDARFSCKYRHYKYFILKEDLDIDLMRQAAEKYIGSHDFRNFCKVDGSKQITNYVREVYHIDITSHDDDFYVLDLKGTAFLWHQVRCMVAVLLSVGQKLEDAAVVDDLLNVEKYPSKPIYDMAYDIPLVLFDCVFPEMEWLKPIDFPKTFYKAMRQHAHVRKMALDLQVKARMATMLKSLAIQNQDKLENTPGGGCINIGDGRGRNYKQYTHILQREFGDTFQQVNAKHLEKKRRRLDTAAMSQSSGSL